MRFEKDMKEFDISEEEFTAKSDLAELGWVREWRMKKMPDRFSTETVELEVKNGTVKLLKLPPGYDSIAIGKENFRVYVNGAADSAVAEGRAVRLPLGKKGDKCPTAGLDLPVLESGKYIFRNGCVMPDQFDFEKGDRITATLLADRKIFINLYGIEAKKIGFTDSMFDNALDLVLDPEEGECAYVIDCTGNDVIITDSVLSAALREQAVLEKAKDGKFVGTVEYTILEGNRYTDIYRFLGQGNGEMNRDAAAESESPLCETETELDLRVKDETEMVFLNGSVEKAYVQDKTFSVSAVAYAGGDEVVHGKMTVSLIDFGKLHEDPWNLIDGTGDEASELCELLYDRYLMDGCIERIREPFLYIEEADGEAEALKFLFANLPYVTKKLYGVRTTAIGAKAEQARSAVTDDFVEEVRDEEFGYSLYRLNGRISYRA